MVIIYIVIVLEYVTNTHSDMTIYDTGNENVNLTISLARDEVIM